MTGAVLGVALLMTAVWVAVPEPRQQLRRLRSRPFRAGGRVAALVQGKEGALPLKVRLLLGMLACAALIVGLPSGPGGAVAGVVALAAVVVGGGQVSRSRGSAALPAELADTVELLAVCLTAGTSMRHALDVVADVSGAGTAPVLAKVSGQLAMGVPEPRAWLELAEDDAWGQVARDIARSSRSGTSLVDVLHVHADEARLVAQERALQKARAVGVRSVVPLVVCFLPAFVLVGVLPIIAGLLGGLLSP